MVHFTKNFFNLHGLLYMIYRMVYGQMSQLVLAYMSLQILAWFWIFQNSSKLLDFVNLDEIVLLKLVIRGTCQPGNA